VLELSLTDSVSVSCSLAGWDEACCDEGGRETASWAFQWVEGNKPERWDYGGVLPYDERRKGVDTLAWVYHRPNNQVNNDTRPRVPMETLDRYFAKVVRRNDIGVGPAAAAS
jgi:hypothetical protein